MFRNAITPGGHPLFMTKGVQLTALTPVLVDFDSQYHDLVDFALQTWVHLYTSQHLFRVTARA